MRLLQRSFEVYTKHFSTKLCSRFCSNNQQSGHVRVRFAPSPTGFLHVGGLRTALYNYLFARAHNGTFIVRIEDTDQKRIVENAQATLFRNLEWAGIIPDESVLHGGNFGPYVQSQRLELYRNQVRKLLENGQAYYCFCTERRLELLRRDAIRAGENPKYDNRCRHLKPDRVAEKLANNDPKVIRFKLDVGISTFHDLVFGEKQCNLESEGDPVIIKSDDFPTYHFANVVDDHFMKITHVLRGVEWHISTPKHLALYKAFGWEPPKFGHLPLILNSNGSKLSKRHNEANVDYYKSLGIFPQTLNNFITFNSSGFEWDNDSLGKSHSMKDMINSFDIEKVNTAASRLQTTDLQDFNRLEIQRQINDPTLRKELIKEIWKIVEASFPNQHESLNLDESQIENALKVSLDIGLNNLQEFVDGDPAFLWFSPKLNDDYVQPEWMDKLKVELETTQFTKENLVTMLRKFAKEEKLSFVKLMKTLRMLLSREKDGFQIAEMMEILGRDGTIQRLCRKHHSKIKQSN